MVNPFSVHFLRVRTTRYLIALLALALAACTPTTSVSTPDPVSTRSSTPLPARTIPSIPPSATSPTPRAILLIPQGADSSLANAVQARLAGLAQAAGLQLETLPALDPANLDDRVKLVVALPPIENLAELARQAPQTHFLAVGFPDLPATDNLQPISMQAGRPDQQAFLAGYLAAVITPDWRVGVLSEAGSIGGKSSQLGFTNGVTYFCGLCRPAYPPFPPSGYPLAFELASGAGETDWQAAITELQAGGVQTVYVDPAIASEALLQALAMADFHLISGVEPPTGLEEQWVASVTTGDPLLAVEAAVKSWESGTQEKVLDQSLQITNVNPAFVSPGRLHLVELLRQDLIDGYVDTGVNPATGESTSLEPPTP